MTEFNASKIIKDLIKALIYLHTLGIMHRDIKPENIMIETGKNGKEFKKAYLIDFGLSCYI